MPQHPWPAKAAFTATTPAGAPAPDGEPHSTSMWGDVIYGRRVSLQERDVQKAFIGWLESTGWTVKPYDADPWLG